MPDHARTAPDAVVDITTTRDEPEQWRNAEQAKFRQQGQATAGNFRNIDRQVIERAQQTRQLGEQLAGQTLSGHSARAALRK